MDPVHSIVLHLMIAIDKMLVGEHTQHACCQVMPPISIPNALHYHSNPAC
uniref:Uncharacterized protein n=1 Tax=Arundo donax TaxID=35708 RepID=A0A0A9FIB3_ARUDO